MSTNDNTTRTSGSMAVGGAVGATGLALGIAGTLFFGGNLVSDSAQNSNPSQLSDTFAYETYVSATCSATGGLLGVYDTCLIASPYNSTASSRGLNTGSGVVRYLQLDIISNKAAVGIDCSVVGDVKTATGGTLFINNASATGAVVGSTTPLSLGPGQYIKCGTHGTPAASFSAKLWGIMGASNVTD